MNDLIFRYNKVSPNTPNPSFLNFKFARVSETDEVVYRTGVQ